MTPEDKKLWCDALRSGEYEQSYEYLNTDRGYCCLGVACEIFGLNAEKYCEEDEYDVFSYEECTESLPPTLQVRLGIGREGKLKKKVTFKGTEVTTLAKLNDLGMSFEAIADVIEDQF